MNDIRIRYRHLQCFLAIAQHRSVGAAADTLAISQPALSKTLRELENILGVRLFDRDPQGMLLTRPGEAFLHHAAASVASLRRGVHSVGQRGSSVTVGALPTVMPRVMPMAVKRFKDRFAETTVRLITSDHTQLLTLLRRDELDLVVGRLARPEEMVGLSFERLYSEPLVVVVRAGHPLTKARPFRLAMIAEYPCMMPPSGTIISQEIDRFLLEQGVPRPANVVEAVSTTFKRVYAREADAVWFAARGIVEPDLAEGFLVSLPLRASTMEGPVGLMTRADMQVSTATAAFIVILRDVACTSGEEVGP